MSKAKLLAFGAAILFAATAIFTLKGCKDAAEAPDQDQDEQGIPAQTVVNNNFPDFGKMIDPQKFYEQFPGEEVFKLKQDYPLTKPGEDKLPAFLEIPFDDPERWMEYVEALRDYCFEGMIEVDFDITKNKKREWYHMPWMHWGDQGSEGFHGLAKEAEISPYQLTAQQSNSHQTYAIGMYNDFAGYTLGKMWKNKLEPNPNATEAPQGGFPIGTVIFKLLFTDANDSEVDYLVNPYTWNAFVSPNWNDTVNRVIKPMQLIQMDFMVRDPRADQYGTGWVFGTFCYNGKLNNGKQGAERAYNLVPVGIQFGNDPENTENWINPYPPKRTIINPNLKQTFINPDSTQLPPQHLGWGGRLDGPVDLNTASCMSCHATAEFPQVGALVPPEAFVGDKNAQGNLTYLTTVDTSALWKKYFSNLRCATPYDTVATSCDFSLQVSLALQYFWEWKNGNVDGFWFDEYERVRQPLLRGGQEDAIPE